MAKLKTTQNESSVTDFLNAIDDEGRRADCFTIVKLMKSATRAEPKMWGSAIVGFGTYKHVYPNGRMMDWPIIGFSPRKRELTLYIVGGLERHEPLLKELGKHKASKGCLYIKSLKDVELPALRKLINESVKGVKKVSKS